MAFLIAIYMNSSLAETLGISADLFHFVVLPLLIFFARIMDVSINTIRIIFMLNGRKGISTLLGFFESMIWILAISQIFQNLNSWPTYVAYAGGFASGIFVGMLIEEKLAIGSVVVRIITSKPANELIEHLRTSGFRYWSLDADSEDGKVNVLFTVVKREVLKETIALIKVHNPNAFYTVEGVKKVGDGEVPVEGGFSTGRRSFGKS
jgi:uncharacterized protein YebE (UPF0316 family)